MLAADEDVEEELLPKSELELRAAASNIRSRAEDLNVQRQRLLLLRYACADASGAALSTGLGAAASMGRASEVEAEQLRMTEEMLSLRSALGAAQAEVEELRRYKAHTQQQLEILVQANTPNLRRQQEKGWPEIAEGVAQAQATSNELRRSNAAGSLPPDQPREENEGEESGQGRGGGDQARGLVEELRQVRLKGAANTELRDIIGRALQVRLLPALSI